MKVNKKLSMVLALTMVVGLAVGCGGDKAPVENEQEEIAVSEGMIDLGNKLAEADELYETVLVKVQEAEQLLRDTEGEELIDEVERTEVQGEEVDACCTECCTECEEVGGTAGEIDACCTDCCDECEEAGGTTEEIADCCAGCGSGNEDITLSDLIVKLGDIREELDQINHSLENNLIDEDGVDATIEIVEGLIAELKEFKENLGEVEVVDISLLNIENNLDKVVSVLEFDLNGHSTGLNILPEQGLEKNASIAIEIGDGSKVNVRATTEDGTTATIEDLKITEDLILSIELDNGEIVLVVK